MTMEANVKRQGYVISKMTARHRTIKYNPVRLTVYEKGKYVSWVSRSEYNKLRADSRPSIRRSVKYPGKHTVRFDRVTLEKPVSVKTGAMKRSKTYTWRVVTHTRTQRRFVVREFKKGKIPVARRSPFQRLVNLGKKFRMLGIRTSAFSALRPSP